MADLKKPPTDPERFMCIYPAYINSKKTIAEGRRIPVEKAVQNPTCVEIADVCRANKLNVIIEGDKMYTRELNRDVQYKGRVRVQMKNEDGSPCVDNILSRKLLLLRVAEDIPKLKTRTQKTGGGDQTVQVEGSKKSKKKKK
ncbi:signal recognition particle 19 kDa protein [Bufo gargarizans]|uniref:signal recognition particle 19 kDa protein n=1 Tax=Bufo gargarizans TaxID=30331 RepID=UPI001CF584AD|nr:signal recognition particle 19 kDa protein [Bufo gargarizans]XP_044131871.1 signal recognition particle 19 kDa protein [Bufo gargarizans]